MYSGNIRSWIFVSWGFGLLNNKVIDDKLRGSGFSQLNFKTISGIKLSGAT